MTPTQSQPNDIEAYLLAFWGREGRMGWALIQQFVDLEKSHGKANVRDAIQKAAEHNKKSFAYVRGILTPRNRRNGQPMFTCKCGSVMRDAEKFDHVCEFTKPADPKFVHDLLGGLTARLTIKTCPKHKVDFAADSECPKCKEEKVKAV